MWAQKINIFSVRSIRKLSSVSATLSREIIKSPSQDPKQAENDVFSKIKSANDSQELLEMFSTTKKQNLEPQHLVFAFNYLYKLQKYGYNSINHKKLTKHSGFENILHMLKFKGPRMEANELVSCLKVVTYFGLRSDSVTTQRLLHLIKDRINELSPNNLMFLSFLLTKMQQKTPLVQAIQIAIPLVFNINLGYMIDHNNRSELAELLHYISTSRLNISEKSMTNIMTACALHGKNFDIYEARSLLWSISNLPTTYDNCDKVFQNCISVLNSRIMEMTFEHVETTLAKLIARIQNGEYFFYDEEFFDNVARFAVEKNVGYMNASYILKKYNKINFVSYRLLSYIEKTILDNHANLSSCKAAGLLTMSNGFSNANFKPENWEILKTLLHENPLMSSNRNDLPWMKFAVNLLSLDFHSNILFEKVFNSTFLENMLNHEDNFLDCAQFLLMYQSVILLIPDYSGPVPEQRYIDQALAKSSGRINENMLKSLSDIFGGREFIQTNLFTKYGHHLEFVISFDKNGDPISMPCKVLSYEELPKSQVTSIAIFFHGKGCYPINYPQKLRGMFELRKRSIEAYGIKTVNISSSLWSNLPENERNAFLEREVRFCLRDTC